jgi:hypothetical protein
MGSFGENEVLWILYLHRNKLVCHCQSLSHPSLMFADKAWINVNTLAYYDTELITAAKVFRVQATVLIILFIFLYTSILSL